MDISQAEYQYISEGFKKLIPEFIEKHKEADPVADAARSAAIVARNDALIIEEYRSAGLNPVINGFGRPTSLYLARMMRLPIVEMHAEHDPWMEDGYAEAQMG